MGKKTERRETQVQIGTVQKRLIDLLTVSNYIGVETRVEGDGVSGGFPVRIMQCRLEVEVPFVFALNRPRPASFWYKETKNIARGEYGFESGYFQEIFGNRYFNSGTFSIDRGKSRIGDKDELTAELIRQMRKEGTLSESLDLLSREFRKELEAMIPGFAFSGIGQIPPSFVLVASTRADASLEETKNSGIVRGYSDITLVRPYRDDIINRYYINDTHKLKGFKYERCSGIDFKPLEPKRTVTVIR